MKVLKRDGHVEEVAFEKITLRLTKLCWGLSVKVDVSKIVQQVAASIHDGIKTSDIDDLTADIAMGFSTEHPHYGTLASRIVVSNLHRKTPTSVKDVYCDVVSKHIFDAEFVSIMEELHETFNALIDFSHDFLIDYFGIRTFMKIYLVRVNDVVRERPQHLFLRVAVALWGRDLNKVKETYDALATHKFVHASPTLFNAGMRVQQLASCFLNTIHDDSLDGIMTAMNQCATISKYGGGIGLSISGVRGKNARINSTNGSSDGVVPMLKVFDQLSAWVNQSGRRKGSFAIYIEPHHPDIMAFLDLKRNTGDEHLRARHLFYAIWVSDLFMSRVEKNEKWSLFQPNTCPGLDDCWGKDYECLYLEYENSGLAFETVDAQDVWWAILTSQIETGTPYILFKDNANKYSNQNHLGTLKTSNLCSEIVQYTSPDEIAVCK